MKNVTTRRFTPFTRACRGFWYMARKGCLYDLINLHRHYICLKSPSPRGGIWKVMVKPLTPILCKHAAADTEVYRLNITSMRRVQVLVLITSQVSTPGNRGGGDRVCSVHTPGITPPSNGEDPGWLLTQMYHLFGFSRTHWLWHRCTICLASLGHTDYDTDVPSTWLL